MKRFLQFKIKALLKFILQPFIKSPLGLVKLMLKERFMDIKTIHDSLWHSFLIKNSNYVESLMSDLTSNLDAESQRIARLIFDRYAHMIHLSRNARFILVPVKDLFTSDELHEQTRVRKFMAKVSKKYKLPINHYEETVFFFKSGLLILEEILGTDRIFDFLRDNIIIDGGGFIGDSLLVFLEYQPSKVIVFEPDPNNLHLLKKTLSLNRIGSNSVLISNFGLSDRKEILNLSSMGSASSTVVCPEENSDIVKIDTINLESFVKENPDILDHGKIKLIKLDIEGSELKAIKGAINLIRDHRPILLISIYHTPEDFFYIKPYLEKNLNSYRYLIRKLNPHHPVYETMLIAYPEELEN